MLVIRPETAEDASAVRVVNEQAFARPNEADLVDALRANAAPIISLVAEWNGRVVGHIFFSPVTVETRHGASQSGGVSPDEAFSAMGLGPLAVLPAYQGQGIGAALVRTGLAACRDAGHDFVVVLGHRHFYPRFGFVPARSRGLYSEYDVPDEVFMVVELRDGALAGRGGLVKYRPEFSGV
ncbi:MAG: N-acetyltransferase [Anaerolineae bacterium]